MSFHVPEYSRLSLADDPRMGSTPAYGNNGVFTVPSPEPGWVLYLICSDGADVPGPLGEWEHVSVSVRQRDKVRIATWKEMAFVKTCCWDDDDCVVQFHPRTADYVNVHPSVLHLWRWKGGDFPMPPIEAV
jgi:hypothetical protein